MLLAPRLANLLMTNPLPARLKQRGIPRSDLAALQQLPKQTRAVIGVDPALSETHAAVSSWLWA
jgi:hypothetical protein